MPRMDNPPPTNQLAKLLLIGDGKCGKTDFAGMAGASGFNVLYLDGDVASQTIADLPLAARKNIYLLKCGDTIGEGGIEPVYTHTIKSFIGKSLFVWNDSAQRQYNMLVDGQANTTDEFWLIRPGLMDHTSVLVLEWTALANSTMLWAAKEHGVDLGEVDVDERGAMRNVHRSAGEKLTQYLIAIQRAPCHVICLSHPQEFVKTQRPDGKTGKETKEIDLKTLWTKMVPKSCSNNHAMSMSKYFTDIAWLEPDMLGIRHIDFRIDRERISGGHFNAKYAIADREKKDSTGFNFAHLVAKVGGIIPGGGSDIDSWLSIQMGFDATPKPKAALSLAANGSKPSVVSTPSIAAIPNSQPLGVLNLLNLKSSGPAKP